MKPLPHALNDLPPQKQAELVRIREIVQEELQAKITSCRKARTKRFRILELIHYTPPCQSRPNPQGKADALLLIIVSHRALADMSAFWEEVEDRLCQDQAIRQNVLCFAHTRLEVIQQLDRPMSLFATIIEDGSRVRGTAREINLPSTFPSTNPERTSNFNTAVDEMSRHYAKWTKLARLYLSAGPESSAVDDPVARNFTTFQLHQAAESAYRMVLHAVAGYTPTTHHLRRMRHLAKAIDIRLEEAWHPQGSDDQRYFDLLCRAYIEARYSLTYRTSEVALRWQADRVAKLIEIADALCLERLSTLGTNDPVPEICQPPQTLV
ncbi:MAG: hypothetical protein CMF01_08090 [Hyphomonas sp.]|nr:hypothetical protein [Hyphomonas sp.]